MRCILGYVPNKYNIQRNAFPFRPLLYYCSSRSRVTPITHHTVPIHPTPTPPSKDDIPIQAHKADGSAAAGSGPSTPLSATATGTPAAAGGSAALVSISEESTSADDQLGSQRNAAQRSSSGSKSDTPRVHKAPFAAFKSKSKDKEAQKQREREAAAAAASAASAAAAAAASAARSNGPSAATAVATLASSTSAASAQRKEKFHNRSSIGAQLQISGDSADSGSQDRTSPCSVIKRLDFVLGGTAASAASAAASLTSPMSQTMSNGDGYTTASAMRSVSQDFRAELAETPSAADAFGDSKRLSVVEAKANAGGATKTTTSLVTAASAIGGGGGATTTV